MCSVTLGGPAPVYSETGMYGPIDQILFPIHRGIFGFVGFTAIDPFVVYGPNRISHEERLTYLARYRQRLLNLYAASTISMPITADARVSS